MHGFDNCTCLLREVSGSLHSQIMDHFQNQKGRKIGKLDADETCSSGTTLIPYVKDGMMRILSSTQGNQGGGSLTPWYGLAGCLQAIGLKHNAQLSKRLKRHPQQTTVPGLYQLNCSSCVLFVSYIIYTFVYTLWPILR